MRNENKEVGACKQELMAGSRKSFTICPVEVYKHSSPFFPESKIAGFNFEIF